MSHHPDCNCNLCHGQPPPLSLWQQGFLALRIEQMFGPADDPPPRYRDRPSPALLSLLSLLSQQASANAKPGSPRNSSKRTAKIEAAKAAGETVIEGDVTGERLRASRADWVRGRGTSRGWLKNAVLTFALDPQTIRSRMK